MPAASARGEGSWPSRDPSRASTIAGGTGKATAPRRRRHPRQIAQSLPIHIDRRTNGADPISPQPPFTARSRPAVATGQAGQPRRRRECRSLDLSAAPRPLRQCPYRTPQFLTRKVDAYPPAGPDRAGTDDDAGGGGDALCFRATRRPATGAVLVRPVHRRQPRQVALLHLRNRRPADGRRLRSQPQPAAGQAHRRPRPPPGRAATERAAPG